MEDLQGSVEGTMWEALETYETERQPGRFGTTLTLILGFAGLGLVGAGTGYAAYVAGAPAAGALASSTANYALGGGLAVVGFVLTLVVLSDGT